MADSMEYRVQSARDMASSHPKIAVLDYEECLPNTYTITLVRRLRQMHPKAHFFYLMGADNMLQLPKWHKWRDIVNDMEVVVLDRNHHHHLLRTSQLCHIFGAPGEKWHFIKIRKNSLSSTEIREQA
jgi:nicotinate-nucleotide adenylyltransferase